MFPFNLLRVFLRNNQNPRRKTLIIRIVAIGIDISDIKWFKQFQQFVKILMFPRPEPKSNDFTALMVNSPSQPDLMLFIVIKAPHFVRFNADSDVFMGFKILFVHILYQCLSLIPVRLPVFQPRQSPI
jgi:hypothetical protein